MKSILTALLALTTMLFSLAQPALADTTLGAKVFNANCAACHSGGMNVVMAPKNLKQETLKQYGMDSVEAISNQVRNGKNVMPAFKSKLSEEEITAVADYVLAQADKGWKK